MIALALYALAAVGYAWHFLRRDRRAGRWATACLVAGILSHTFMIGMQTVQTGHVPLAGMSEAVSAFVWLLALAYLYTEVSTDERVMGTFILPLIVGLMLFAAGNAAQPRPPVLHDGWLELHVLSVLFAYASFGLACVIGITYVLLFNEIKARHLGFFYARLPPLQTLDRMNIRAVVVGWLCLTVGVVVGIVWAGQAAAQGSIDPRVQAMSVHDPKIFVAVLCWAVYSFQVIAWRTAGWRGRRAAWLSALGFAIVLVNLLPISYYLTRSHNF
jgi:ABC-type transport system involved in cytochrome c biogenesis permease subunit